VHIGMLNRVVQAIEPERLALFDVPDCDIYGTWHIVLAQYRHRVRQVVDVPVIERQYDAV
jgi:hypothetical protein